MTDDPDRLWSTAPILYRKNHFFFNWKLEIYLFAIPLHNVVVGYVFRFSFPQLLPAHLLWKQGSRRKLLPFDWQKRFQNGQYRDEMYTFMEIFYFVSCFIILEKVLLFLWDYEIIILSDISVPLFIMYCSDIFHIFISLNLTILLSSFNMTWF